MDVRYLLVGDRAITVEFGSEISLEVNSKVRMLQYELEKNPILGITETVPTYAALMIHYRPEVIRFRTLCEELDKRMDHLGAVEMPKAIVTEVPVWYDMQVGPDLEDCAAMEQMSVEEFIKVHSQSEYYVYMLGFAPGHPYTARFENEFSFKRREFPRVKIPANSIVAQTNLTNIIPFDQPCGWNIIGATPVKACDYRREEPFLLAAGQWVRYVPITEKEYHEISRQAEAGTYQCKTYEKEVKP